MQDQAANVGGRPHRAAPTEIVMRPMYYLLPRMKMNSGGHLAQVRILEIAQSICQALPVTYVEREDGVPFLDELLSTAAEDAIFVVHWGPHVPGLLRRLSGRRVVYHAHSTGYGFTPPPGVPIIAVSRHSLAYFGRHAPNAPLYRLPNVLGAEFRDVGVARDVDVLVQRRKASRYLLDELVPALRDRCRVEVLDAWVDDLVALFNRSKVYLYDSTEHWLAQGVSEGHGLPPLEAMACGCSVFSGVNDGLADYLDPGINCGKLRVYAKQFDVERILAAVATWSTPGADATRRATEEMLDSYRRPALEARLRVIIEEVNRFFDAAARMRPDLADPRKAARRARRRRALSGLVPGFARSWVRAIFR
jgi:glycosyltransferase involved in cell wall biosynthesis